MASEKSNIFRQVGIAIAAIAVAALIFFGGVRYQKREYTEAEKYLQEQLEEARHQADIWKERYDESVGEKTILLSKVDSLDNKIKELKKNYGQKIIAVKSYTNPELERFFSERYGN